MQLRRTMRIAAVCAAASALVSSGAIALPIDGTIEAPAAAATTAVRIRVATTGDLVSVSEVSSLSAATIDAASAAAAGVGATVSTTSAMSVGMVSVHRNGAVVAQAAGDGGGLWQWPVSISILPIDTVRAVMSDGVAGVLGAGQVAMSVTSASLVGIVVGDVVDLVAANGSIVSYGVGLVAPDGDVGGAEIVMSPAQAAIIGPVVPTRVLIHGQFDRTALEQALAGRGMYDSELFQGHRLRVRRSWGPSDPDSTMGSARTKALLGLFDYRVNSDDSVSVDPDWRSTRIVKANFADIPIRTNCNTAIVADLQAALTEVAQAGLSGAIEVANTNTYGGCYYPRFNRVTGNLGFLSRHSWGQPIDMNTVSNAQGKAPKMDCGVVRIFRKHGFAWGGNFLSRDGMHFEWVGEPRDQLAFPSAFCPNQPATGTQSFGLEVSNRATFFADDGWASTAE